MDAPSDSGDGSATARPERQERPCGAPAESPQAETWVSTSNVVSSGGAAKPPSMPASKRGIRVPSRNFSQLSLESWIATIVHPSADGPATCDTWPSGRLPSLGWMDATAASYCSLVPPANWCTTPYAICVLLCICQPGSPCRGPCEPRRDTTRASSPDGNEASRVTAAVH